MQSTGNNPAAVLADEINAGNALLQLLKQEQQHLVNADIDGLTSLTEEKTKAVARMTEQAHRRHRALGAAGFEASEAGMQAWLSSPKVTPPAAKAWKELLHIAQQSKELNRTNGLLIGQHLGRNQAALNVLQGNQQNANMYGPDGQAAPKAGSRRLVVG